ncbi:Uncharacterized membrane-anchored protein YitT, contains DUF161 and DUF2179 domains [Desulfatibacillum alkenivorans DSM 16219]|jgi:uncharacterized membrane-anchored protein YitT (DUF2179 family)|uniref:Uncharacterized membrane-anchored protein YitT, contains DUF161 and DUF2179 domains n=1 Tax=Desulfatibacillum alkenivorans DSM 16219 TaxID=1121393 RepID=A0A1M6PSK4_9BACT|nr:YitT family protein [Desulfatibacillum alkenivorans]SHK10871.1 Uncharacterized membrane-anchored protein YitT, contains DUF161 and DUF2179 domains [Desulfatibacillum alkenivorans DSM 16219]
MVSETCSDNSSRGIAYSPAWNMFLIFAGSLIAVAALKGIAVHQHLVPGGAFGLALLIHYAGVGISAGILFMLLNIPLAILGYLNISKRFILYSIWAMAVSTIAYEVMDLNFGIENPIYASIACGGIMGFGMGVVLRTLGSNGGMDIAAIILNRKYNIGIGKTYFVFNLLLFCASAAVIDQDLVIGSILTVFVASVTIDYVLSMFSNRKMVMIISQEAQCIVDDIMTHLNQGATMLQGQGCYSRTPRPVIMTITNNVQLRRLEEIVFTKDPQAIFIVENTFAVLGSSFTKRKLY